MATATKRSDAHRKADKAYNQKTTQVIMRFKKDDPADQARLAWLNNKGNKTEVIKSLIDEKMSICHQPN